MSSKPFPIIVAGCAARGLSLAASWQFTCSRDRDGKQFQIKLCATRKDAHGLYKCFATVM